METGSMESRYECPICINWLNEPVVTSCGHRFCKECITSWLKYAENVHFYFKYSVFFFMCMTNYVFYLCLLQKG